jgi:multicomponent Na+:H+ antiporter subunit C
MKGFEMEGLRAHYNYIVFVILLMLGLYGMIGKNNLVKKVIGMSLFQTAIILFYISSGVKEGGGIPILLKGQHVPEAIIPALFDNPLPHVLMLTAIVVGVSTLGVALALIQNIYARYGTLEEDEIMERSEQ